MSDEILARNADLMRAYRLCFSSDPGKMVMADMMRFCCFRKEAETPIDEGKRQAFLRIVNFSQLADEQLYSLYAGRDIGEVQDE